MTCPSCKNNLKTNFVKEQFNVLINCKTCATIMGKYPKKYLNIIKYENNNA